MANTFSPVVCADLEAFYKVHNPGKVASLPGIIEDAKAKGIPPETVFDSLYRKYGVKALPDRENAVLRLKAKLPGVAEEAIVSAVRRSELQSLSESDTLHYLERTFRQSTPPPTASAAAKPPPEQPKPKRARALSITPNRCAVDRIMEAECREWLASTLGDLCPPDLKTAENLADTLRDGVVLQILLQKLNNPALTEVKRPKNTGFYARDNISRFIQAVRREPFNLRDEVMFDDSDLCDGKNDRAVITALLALAKIAYRKGVSAAPSIVRFDAEIDEQVKNLKEDEIDQAIAEATAEEAQQGSNAPQNPPAIDPAILEEENVERQRIIADETADSDGICAELMAASLRILRAREEQEAILRAAITSEYANAIAEFNQAWFSSLQQLTRKPLKALEIQEESERTLVQMDREQWVSVTGAQMASEKPVPQSPRLREVKMVVEPLVPLPQPKPALVAVVEETVAHGPDDSSPKAYKAKHDDDVDQEVGKSFNKMLLLHANTHTRVKRTKNKGEYIIYHKITGKRTVVYVRVVQKHLMIRVGGGWDDFNDFLARRLVDWEFAPEGTAARLNRQEAIQKQQSRK